MNIPSLRTNDISDFVVTSKYLQFKFVFDDIGAFNKLNNYDFDSKNIDFIYFFSNDNGNLSFNSIKLNCDIKLLADISLFNKTLYIRIYNNINLLLSIMNNKKYENKIEMYYANNKISFLIVSTLSFYNRKNKIEKIINKIK